MHSSRKDSVSFQTPASGASDSIKREEMHNVQKKMGNLPGIQFKLGVSTGPDFGKTNARE